MRSRSRARCSGLVDAGAARRRLHSAFARKRNPPSNAPYGAGDRVAGRRNRQLILKEGRHAVRPLERRRCGWGGRGGPMRRSSRFSGAILAACMLAAGSDGRWPAPPSWLLRALGARDAENERRQNKGDAGKWPLIMSISAILFNFSPLTIITRPLSSISPGVNSVLERQLCIPGMVRVAKPP